MKEQLNKLREKPATELARAKRRIATQVGVIVLTSLTVCAIIFGLTSAWYTNIVKQNSITVTAAEWGVDVTIDYPEPDENDHYSLVKDEDGAVTGIAFTNMYPGDIVDIKFNITNNGSVPAKVRLDLSKSDLPAEMQRRLYFYKGDDWKTGTYYNSENDSEYVYTVKARGDAEGKDVVSGAIHCIWTEDLLGYYFVGTVTKQDKNDNGTTLTTYKEEATEYLKPIWYDITTASYDENFRLTRIFGKEGDSTGTVALYLWDLYGKNTDALGSYYYLPDDVEREPSVTAGTVTETPYTGRFLYLCPQNIIQAASEYDTNLGMAERERRTAWEAQNHSAGDTYTPANTFTVTMTFAGEPAA